jgi:hypothetical protein
VKAFYTTGEVADFVGTDEWRIRRLFENGVIIEPARFGGKRAVPSSLIPTIIDALRARNWLPGSKEAAP